MGGMKKMENMTKTNMSTSMEKNSKPFEILFYIHGR